MRSCDHNTLCITSTYENLASRQLVYPCARQPSENTVCLCVHTLNWMSQKKQRSVDWQGENVGGGRAHVTLIGMHQYDRYGKAM